MARSSANPCQSQTVGKSYHYYFWGKESLTPTSDTEIPFSKVTLVVVFFFLQQTSAKAMLFTNESNIPQSQLFNTMHEFVFRSRGLVSAGLRILSVVGSGPRGADHHHGGVHAGTLRQLRLADVLSAHVQRHQSQLEATPAGGQHRGMWTNSGTQLLKPFFPLCTKHRHMHLKRVSPPLGTNVKIKNLEPNFTHHFFPFFSIISHVFESPLSAFLGKEFLENGIVV